MHTVLKKIYADLECLASTNFEGRQRRLFGPSMEKQIQEHMQGSKVLEEASKRRPGHTKTRLTPFHPTGPRGKAALLCHRLCSLPKQRAEITKVQPNPANSKVLTKNPEPQASVIPELLMPTNLPATGRTGHCLHNWLLITGEEWTLETISGMPLIFTSPPHLVPIQTVGNQRQIPRDHKSLIDS